MNSEKKDTKPERGWLDRLAEEKRREFTRGIR
jgi:hypothetical protein